MPSSFKRLDINRYNVYHGGMKDAARAGRETRPIGSAEEAAFLDLIRTADILTRGVVQVLKGRNLSGTQYNVLRILRGARQALACSEIASRMITRDPDITRLLDRLEKRQLVSRSRETKDRRMVFTRITPQGLKVLATLDEPIQAAHRRQLGQLGPKRMRELAALLQAVRGARE